jgi:choline-sulfatase
MPHKKPNILFISADQLPASTVGAYGNSIVKTPHLDALAETGVLFENCYCNSPLCAPSRASLFSGKLVSNLGVYDNGCEMKASELTFVHFLRIAGYRTALSGKGHFVGPDQLHGFEQRLTTDIYPSSFLWSPDWSDGVTLNYGSNVEQVHSSGICSWSLQLDYDEETSFKAHEWLRSYARSSEQGDDRPFFLNVSFTHPHDPFIINEPWWNLYRDEDIPLPDVRESTDKLHQFNKWLQIHHGIHDFPIDETVTTAARHAFYGMCSYLDSLVGRLVQELRNLGLYENTVIVFTSDHGEMLGEHGMWFKRTYFENCAKVPLIISWPEEIAFSRNIPQIVSLVDLFPTFYELAGIDGTDPYSNLPDQKKNNCKNDIIEGNSILPLLFDRTDEWKDEAILEYCGEGVEEPMRMLRTGQYKYIYVHNNEPVFYDMQNDPLEQHNIAGTSAAEKTEAHMKKRLLQDWDPEKVKEEILNSQKTRKVLNAALHKGIEFSWDYDPPFDAAHSYVRHNSQTENLKAVINKKTLRPKKE